MLAIRWFGQFTSSGLASFLHEDFVTAIAFHPRNDKYFLSGSLDCKLRLWNIPEKKVALWNEVGSEGCNLITAANFCSGGKYAVVRWLKTTFDYIALLSPPSLQRRCSHVAQHIYLPPSPL